MTGRPPAPESSRGPGLLARAAIVALSSTASLSGQVVFEPPEVVAVGSLASNLAVGDVDGNGTADLLVAEFSGSGFTSTLLVLLGDGSGGFMRLTSELEARPALIALHPVDADQHLDLVFTGVTGFGTSGLGVALGRGDGSFAPVITSPAGTNPRDFALGDFDDDAILDALVYSVGDLKFGPRVLNVLRGVGDGTFTTAQVLQDPAQDRVLDMALGDVDGDGTPDFATSSYDDTDNESTLRIHLGAGDGRFDTQASWTLVLDAVVPSLLLADVDHDGHLDLVISNRSGTDGEVSAYPGAGDGTFGPPRKTAIPEAQGELVAAHLDDDGTLDLVMVQALFGPEVVNEILVLRGLGNGFFDVDVQVTPHGRLGHPVVADLDGDRRPDVAAVSRLDSGEGAIEVFRNHTYGPSEPFLDLGLALKGSAGWPILLASGGPPAGDPYVLRLANGPPRAQAFLILGRAAAWLPFAGGTIVPSPDLVVGPYVLDDGGEIVLRRPPLAALSGITIYLQAWFEDPQAPTGFGSTTGLRVRLP